MVLCPAILDREIASLDVAGIVQASAEGGDKGRVGLGGDAAEKTYQPHRLLLRGGNARQRYRAAKQGNEAPTVHSILMQPRPRENLAQRDPMGAASTTQYQSPR